VTVAVLISLVRAKKTANSAESLPELLNSAQNLKKFGLKQGNLQGILWIFSEPDIKKALSVGLSRFKKISGNYRRMETGDAAPSCETVETAAVALPWSLFD
jgi:hypothetical protein